MGSVMQNMQLRATSLELASYTINTVVVTLFDEPILAAGTGIHKGYSPLCSLVIGKATLNVRSISLAAIITELAI